MIRAEYQINPKDKDVKLPEIESQMKIATGCEYS